VGGSAMSLRALVMEAHGGLKAVVAFRGRLQIYRVVYGQQRQQVLGILGGHYRNFPCVFLGVDANRVSRLPIARRNLAL